MDDGHFGLAVELVLVAVFALIGLAKLVGQVQVRAAARRRLRGGQLQLSDNTVVTVTGTVRAIGEPLVAPLSGRRCVLHLSIARSQRIRHWLCEMVRFELETRDGTVIVDGVTAEVTLRPGAIVPRDLDRERAFLRAHDITATDARGVSCEEVVIEPGMKIVVNGVARYEQSPNASGEAGFRDALSTIRLVGHARHPLTIGPA
jgi:hypothetical protein